MPMYSYRCSSCSHEFDAQQRITEDPLSDCPKCGESVQRIIGKNVGIQFVGAGFYVNDTKTKKASPSSTDS